jgi:hypothetical protein
MSVQHGNLGVVKKDLQLYYNREYIKSFRGEAATNYAGAITSNCESAAAYWSSTITKDTSTGYTALKVVPLSGGYQSGATWYSCGIIAGNGGFQPAGTYSLSAKVLLPKDSVFTLGFRAYPYGEEFPVDITGTGTWQTIKRENFTCTGYNYIQLQLVRRINGVTSSSSAIFPGEPFWIRDIMINSGSYAKPFSLVTNELSARPENTTNITNNANFASAISGTDSGGTQNGWTFGSWSGTGNAYATQASTTIYSAGSTSYSAIPLRVTRAAAGSMDFFSANWNTLSNGTVYTISFWARSNNTTTLDIKHQNLGTLKSYTVDPANGWYKYAVTFTHAGGTQYPYLTHAGSNGSWIEIANVQLEAKSYPTDFTTSNRTSIANKSANGGGLIDLSGNSFNADLTNVTFDSTGYIFNGSNTYVLIKSFPVTDAFYTNTCSISIWFKTSVNQDGVLIGWGDNTTTNFGGIEITSDWTGGLTNESLIAESWRNFGASPTYQRAAILKGANYYSNNTWTNVAVTSDDNMSNLKIYINGVLESTANDGNSSGAFFLNCVPSGTTYVYLGQRTYPSSAVPFSGQISQVKIYNRTLSAAEILRNFNATRKTYGV